MFPGYVLIGTDNVKDLYKLICENEKVFKVLETDKEYSEVQYDEIFHILKMSDKKGAIGESELFVADDTVFVKSGPLLNFDGTIKKVDKRNKRSTIWFQFNGEPHEIQICTTVLTANSENDYARLKKIAVERKGTI
jgi:transcription antitermination factor NusG